MTDEKEIIIGVLILSFLFLKGCHDNTVEDYQMKLNEVTQLYEICLATNHRR